MNNIIQDLSLTTTIKKSVLDKLVENTCLLIAHSVAETAVLREDICELDIGIGTLMLLRDEDCIKYKFIPSPKLEMDVVKAYKTKQSPMIRSVDDSLKRRVENIYKELL